MILPAVGEFRKLALMAEADGHLRQKLQQVLKLSKEKWDDARDHAMRAVVADNRMRIWLALILSPESKKQTCLFLHDVLGHRLSDLQSSLTSMA